MNRYTKRYYDMCGLLLKLNGKVLREGLLALEEELGAIENSFLESALRLVVDGTDVRQINDILSFFIENEKNSEEAVFKRGMKQAVLDITEGVYPFHLRVNFNSFFNIPDYAIIRWKEDSGLLEECKLASNPKAEQYSGQKYFNLCREAVSVNGMELAYIRQDKLTAAWYFDICHAALANKGMALAFVNQDTFSAEQCVALYTDAVAHNGEALKYVNAALCTGQAYFELCRVALKQWGELLQYVNENKCSTAQYRELCLEAVSSRGRYQSEYEEDTLVAVPDDFRGDRPLRFVKEALLTSAVYYEICFASVSKNGYSLEYVKETMLTPAEYHAICRAAVSDGNQSEYSHALQYIKPKEIN